jgi:iron complex outermembrane recepter protein
MKKLLMVFLTVALGFVLGFGMQSNAFAQETKSEEFTLEEITVTAEKRAVNIQKTAMNITAVSGDEIATHAVSNVSEVLDGLAAVKVMAGPMGGNIFIRGIGSGLDTNMASPSVSLQKDNVYLGQSEAVLGALFDVERVEVLYGPQGTMYGAGSAGGQVNVITKNPSDKFEANGDLSVGTYRLNTYNAALNVPLSSVFAARLAINQQYHDGYLSDGSGSSDKFSSRIKLLYKPSDKVSVLLTTDFTWDKSSTMNTVPIPGSAGNLPADPGRGGAWADPTLPTTGWVIPYGGDEWTNDLWHPKPRNNTKYQLYSLQADVDMGFAKLTFIPTLNTNYRSLWSDLITGSSIAGADLMNQTFREKQYTAEMRLSNGSDSPLIWTTGVYYLKRNNRNPNEVTTDLRAQALSLWDTGSVPPSPGGPPPGAPIAIHTVDNPLVANYQSPQDSYAAFGQATYPVTDKFRVVGGLRWNNENNKLKMRIVIWDVTQNGGLSQYYSQATATADGRHEYDSGVFTYTLKTHPFTYKGGLEYDVDSTKMLYATYSTGFKRGGLNTIGTFPPVPYDPEKVINYSIGAKTRFMDNTLQVNAEAYYYDYTGYQVQTHGGRYYDPLRGQYMDSPGQIANAKDGTNSGVEISTDWLMTAEDRLSVTFAYMKTELGEFVVPAQGPAPEMVLTGTDLPKAPHFSGTLGYEHTFSLEDGGTITPKFQTKLSTGFYNTIEQNLVGSHSDGYSMSDFYLAYASANGKYSTVLWVKNVENSVVTDYVFPLYRRIIMEPRTSGITFSVRF